MSATSIVLTQWSDRHPAAHAAVGLLNSYANAHGTVALDTLDRVLADTLKALFEQSESLTAKLTTATGRQCPAFSAPPGFKFQAENCPQIEAVRRPALDWRPAPTAAQFQRGIDRGGVWVGLSKDKRLSIGILPEKLPGWTWVLLVHGQPADWGTP